jgi:hypothetical protein
MSVSYHARSSTFRILRPGDVSFRLQDGIITVSRAGLDISRDCPEHHVEVILECLRQGWLTPVAAVPDTDPTLMWDTLRS